MLSGDSLDIMSTLVKTTSLLIESNLFQRWASHL